MAQGSYDDLVVYILIGACASLAVICVLFTIYFFMSYWKRKNEAKSRKKTSKSDERDVERTSKKLKSSKIKVQAKSNEKAVKFNSDLEEEQDDDEVSDEKDFKKAKSKSVNSRPASPKKKEKKTKVSRTKSEETDSSSESDEFFHKETKKSSKSPKNNNKLLVEEVNENNYVNVTQNEEKRKRKESYEEGSETRTNRGEDYDIVRKQNVRQAQPLTLSPIQINAESNSINQMESNFNMNDYETFYAQTKNGTLKPVLIPKKQPEQPQPNPSKQRPRINSSQDREVSIFTIETNPKKEIIKYKRRSPSPHSEEG